MIYNPRVGKIARSLSKKFSTLVLGWNREGLPKEVTRKYGSPLELFDVRAPYAKLSLAVYFPYFWIWLFIKLVKYRPKAVHACDLDVVMPCYIYRLIFGRKLVFDVCDRYAMTYTHIVCKRGSTKYKILYSLLNYLEEAFAEKADVLVNVSNKLLETFRRTPRRSEIIMNCAEDRYIASQKKEDGKFRIVYTGLVRRTRGLEEVVAAIREMDNIELDIAGRVLDIDFLNEITRIDYVNYKGLLSPSDALRLEANSDVSVVFYDPEEPINAFSMGNKMFEAMMLGLPIISNVAHEMVHEVGYGITVDYQDIRQIRDAIVSLKENPRLREEMGNNGRKAFQEKYNWQNMENRLHRLYGDLVNKS
jgi:glycosyltransferase involved in cell wall biosynthesis